MNYKLTLKRADTGKWWTYGNVKTNPFGKLQCSFKVTKELRDLVSGKQEGEYINFSMFEDEGKPQAKPYQPPEPVHATPQDEIPF